MPEHVRFIQMWIAFGKIPSPIGIGGRAAVCTRKPLLERHHIEISTIQRHVDVAGTGARISTILSRGDSLGTDLDVLIRKGNSLARAAAVSFEYGTLDFAVNAYGIRSCGNNLCCDGIDVLGIGSNHRRIDDLHLPGEPKRPAGLVG